MSGVVYGQVLKRYPRGRAIGEYTLALALADIAQPNGTQIYPSLATMAHLSYQDERSVQRHLRALLEAGWLILVRAHRGGRGDRGMSAEYRISPRWLAGEELPGLVPGVGRKRRQTKGDKVSSFSDAAKGDKVSSFSTQVGDEERTTQNAGKDDNGDSAYKNGKERNTPLSPQGGAGAFDSLCSAYPAHRVNHHQARKRWAQLKPDDALAELMVRAARAQAQSAEWQANNGHAVPNLSGWILNCKWRATHDERAPAAQTSVIKEERASEPVLTEAEREAKRQAAAEARNKLREIAGQAKRGMAAA